MPEHKSAVELDFVFDLSDKKTEDDFRLGHGTSDNRRRVLLAPRRVGRPLGAVRNVYWPIDMLETVCDHSTSWQLNISFWPTDMLANGTHK